jgi:uncharacterized protein YidB (DUF937 family)
MSLVDAVQGQISGEALRSLAADLGRTEEETRAATAAALPAVLASLSNQVLDGQALDGLLRSLRDRPAPAAEAAGAMRAPDDSDVLGAVLGPNRPALIDLLARTTGLEEPAVRKLLAALGPAVLDAVADRSRAEGGLDAGRMVHVFASEKSKIAAALPEGLTLADLPSIPGVPTSVPTPADVKSGVPGWVLPALAVALVAASVWILIKQPVETPAARKAAAPAQPPSAEPTPPPPPIERDARPSGG